MYQLLKLRVLLPITFIILLFFLFITSSMQASTAASPAGGPLMEATVPTLAPLIDLSISNNSGNAKLDWSDSLAASSYAVHRSTNPFFSPSGGTLQTTLPGTTKEYVDTTGGVNNLSVNYFYLVTASTTSGSFNSNGVGEIDYPLKNTNGDYSFIGIPFLSPSPSDAAGLAAQIGNVSNIYHWDPNSQTFQVFTPPNIENFTFGYGEAVFVQVGNGVPSSTNIMGKVDRSALTLYPNKYSFIAMPLRCQGLTNASSTAASIIHVINLLKWDLTFQSFQTFTPPSFGDNFALQIGEPFIVQLDASGPTSWPTDQSTGCQ